MRLGLVIYGSLETLSGGYLYDRKLVEHLRAQGDTVEVISLPWQNYAAHLGQNLARGLESRLVGLAVDILLQDELNHPSLFWLNRRLRGRVGYPLVSIVHHLRSSEAFTGPARALYRRVERAYLNTVDGFIFNSHTTRQAVQNLLGHPAEGVVAYPGGDRFGERLSENAARLRAQKSGPLRLLFVGNLIERKGLHTLIAALARLPRGCCTLHVVGPMDTDPAYTRRIQAQIRACGLAEQVFLLGRLPENYLRDEWKRCQVLVVPSQYEGFGIVYLEGMAYGVPSIAGQGGAAGELIRDGENGYLVPPDDPAVLAERLALLAGDRQHLEVLSLGALRRYADFPTWEASAGRIRDYLLGLLAAPR